MDNEKFNIMNEWDFIYQETVNNAPKIAKLAATIETRELLLKAQIILGMYGLEKNIDNKKSIIIQYNFIKNQYCQLINGGLN